VSAASNPTMEWFDLRQLTRYAAVFERTLRAWVHDPINPLPAYQVNGKILVKKRDFDNFIEQHPIRTCESVNRIVDEILAEVTAGD